MASSRNNVSRCLSIVNIKFHCFVRIPLSLVKRFEIKYSIIPYHSIRV
jgi:hypothetical protein